MTISKKNISILISEGKKLRIDTGLSQDRVAFKARIALNTVKKIEKDNTNITVDSLISYLEGCGYDVNK